MFYSIVSRILRRHAFFHLIVPLVVGVFVEALYAHFLDHEHVPWTDMGGYLLSPHRIALYAGIAVTYMVVIAFLAKSETNIGMRRIELNELATKLRTAKRLFAVAPTPLGEWFDPAAQVYFATIFGARLSDKPFRYERVLLLPGSRTRRDLNSEYLDGYHARCLIDIHKRLGIDLYFLEWEQIKRVLDELTPEQKVFIGYYPRFASKLPDAVTKALLWPVRRRRVRRIAGGVVTDSADKDSAFRFAKSENVVEVEVEPEARSDAYVEFVKKLQVVLYEPSGKVKPAHDFRNYYD